MSCGKVVPLILALSHIAIAQTFAAAPANPWPTTQDASPKPYLRVAFSSQGSQGLRDRSGGLPHGFQMLHVSVINRSGRAQDVPGSAIYQAAVFAGYAPVGPEAAAAVLRGPSKRGALAALSRLLDVAPAGVSIGLSAARASPAAQLAGAVSGLVFSVVRNGIDARRVDPAPAISRIVQELDSAGHPVSFPIAAGSAWAGDIGALFTGRHYAVLVDEFEDGSMSIVAAVKQ